MKKIWFVSSERTIRGPLTSEELSLGLEQGQLTTNSMVWWKGQSQWISLSRWKAQLPHLSMLLDADQKPALWSFEHQDQRHGPMSLEQMIQRLQKSPDMREFKINKVGSSHWTGVYSNQEVLEALGLTRRVHHRVPLNGVAHIQMPYDSIVTEVATISEGGFGVIDANLPTGHIVQFLLKSPMIPSPVRSRAEVLYTRDDGFSGLKFERLHVESQSLIMDYIKKFSKAS